MVALTMSLTYIIQTYQSEPMRNVMPLLNAPSSSAFFKGQSDAKSGAKSPKIPQSNASFEEHLYYRGYMQQVKKTQQSLSFNLASYA